MGKFRLHLSSALIALLGGLLLWSVISWPLPAMFTDTVSISPRAPKEGPIMRMYPGDHLQLLYQLWLGHDTFFGDTPWSTNLYEFNTGDDEARKAYSTYYFPFNFFYSLGHVFGGPAVGMNMAAILSLVISLWATLLWLRRWFPDRPVLVACAALAGQCLPYRWHALLHGSPTGMAMMWIPVLLLGMDIWIRDQKLRGSVLAGAAVFFSGWSDTHALFFSGLLAPAWLLPNFWAVHQTLLPGKDLLIRLIKSGWPLALWVLLTGVQVLQVQGIQKGTNVEEGRDTEEVAIFSPEWEEIYERSGWGGLAETYLGPVFLVLIVAGAGVALWKAFGPKRNPEERAPALLLAGLVVTLVVITLVATGPNHPMGGIWWARTLRIFPPLSKLRQPAKIYLLLPAFISLMFALSLKGLPKGWAQRLLPPVLCLAVAISFVARITPHLCILADRSPAYEAVAADADTPRALVLPLWPGDSHWSSVYVYFAMREQLRLVNGYRPSRNLAYMEEIFEVYHPFNQGDIPAEKLDALLERGITHLLLHENAFPEKVSPFSVGNTLNILLTHPRLELLKQSGPVWAFRIQPGASTPDSTPDWKHWAAVQRQEAEQIENPPSVFQSDAFSGGAALVLKQLDGKTDLWAPAVSLPEERKLFVRALGEGKVTFSTTHGEQEPTSTHLAGALEAEWMQIPISPSPGFLPLEVSAEVTRGQITLDQLVLGPSQWDPSASRIDIHPTAMFHAGHTDLEADAVVLDPERDPATSIFYGPRLPLETGEITVELIFSSSAADGTLLGTFRTRRMPTITEVEVKAGQPVVLTYSHSARDLFSVEFDYAGSAEVLIKGVTVTRSEP